jgi:hypothetical protein
MTNGGNKDRFCDYTGQPCDTLFKYHCGNQNPWPLSWVLSGPCFQGLEGASREADKIEANIQPGEVRSKKYAVGLDTRTIVLPVAVHRDGKHVGCIEVRVVGGKQNVIDKTIKAG